MCVHVSSLHVHLMIHDDDDHDDDEYPALVCPSIYLPADVHTVTRGRRRHRGVLWQVSEGLDGWVWMYTYACMYVCMYVCGAGVYMYGCMHVCMYVCVYSMYLCMCVCMYV